MKEDKNIKLPMKLLFVFLGIVLFWSIDFLDYFKITEHDGFSIDSSTDRRFEKEFDYRTFNKISVADKYGSVISDFLEYNELSYIVSVQMDTTDYNNTGLYMDDLVYKDTNFSEPYGNTIRIQIKKYDDEDTYIVNDKFDGDKLYYEPHDDELADIIAGEIPRINQIMGWNRLGFVVVDIQKEYKPTNIYTEVDYSTSLYYRRFYRLTGDGSIFDANSDLTHELSRYNRMSIYEYSSWIDYLGFEVVSLDNDSDDWGDLIWDFD